MRTTLRLVRQIISKAKQLAAQSVDILSVVIRDARPNLFARLKTTADRPPTHLTTVSGNGLMPGVDLDDSAALLELMEKPDGSSRR